MLDWHYLDWWLFWVRPTGFPTNQSWFIFQTQRVTLGTEGISQVLTSPNTSLLPTQSLECKNAPCSISISERRTEGLTSHPGSVSMHRSNEPSISRVLCSQELSFPHSKLYPYYPAKLCQWQMTKWIECDLWQLYWGVIPSHCLVSTGDQGRKEEWSKGGWEKRNVSE